MVVNFRVKYFAEQVLNMLEPTCKDIVNKSIQVCGCAVLCLGLENNIMLIYASEPRIVARIENNEIKQGVDGIESWQALAQRLCSVSMSLPPPPPATATATATATTKH